MPEQQAASPHLFGADRQRDDVRQLGLCVDARTLILRAARRERVENDDGRRRAGGCVGFRASLDLDTEDLAAAFAQRPGPERARAKSGLIAIEAALRQVEAARPDVQRSEILIVAFEPQIVLPPLVEANPNRAVVVPIRVVDETTHRPGRRLRVDRLIFLAVVEVAEEGDAGAMADVARAVDVDAGAVRRGDAHAEGIARLGRLGAVPRGERQMPRLRPAVGNDLDERGSGFMIFGVERILADPNLLDGRCRRQAAR